MPRSSGVAESDLVARVSESAVVGSVVVESEVSSVGFAEYAFVDSWLICFICLLFCIVWDIFVLPLLGFVGLCLGI